MHSRLLFIISAMACFSVGHLAVAEEVGTGGAKTVGVQTSTTNGALENPGGPITEGLGAKPAMRGGGNVEWRRNDHGAPNPGRSAGESNRGTSDRSGGSGSDGGGGGSGSTD